MFMVIALLTAAAAMTHSPIFAQKATATLSAAAMLIVMIIILQLLMFARLIVLVTM
jgi:hypothetical protein